MNNGEYNIYILTFSFEERWLAIPQVSLLYLTLDADFTDDVMWSRIDGKHIVSVPHHDGLFVGRVDDCMAEEIDRGTYPQTYQTHPRHTGTKHNTLQ